MRFSHRQGMIARLAAGAIVVITAAAGLTLGLRAAPRAAAATTGYSYAVGLVTTGRQSFTMLDITSAEVQADQGAVDATMSAAELSAATAALGGAPTGGFKITKTFDETDRAQFMAGLAQTKITNVGLFIYYNGTLVDHVREMPGYVAYVDQAGPQVGSTSAASDTIEFVTTALTRVGTAAVPVPSLSEGTGAGYSGTLEIQVSGGTAGARHLRPDATDAYMEFTNMEQASMQSGESQVSQTGCQGDLSGPCQAGFTITKEWSAADNKYAPWTLNLAEEPQLVLSWLDNDQAYVKYTFTDVVVESVDVTYAQPGTTTAPLETWAFSGVIANLSRTS